MNNSMKQIKEHDEFIRLQSLAETQARFVKNYIELLNNEEDKFYFQRDLFHMINLTYREAQEPLIKQLTDYIMMNNSPVIKRDPF